MLFINQRNTKRNCSVRAGLKNVLRNLLLGDLIIT